MLWSKFLLKMLAKSVVVRPQGRVPPLPPLLYATVSMPLAAGNSSLNPCGLH